EVGDGVAAGATSAIRSACTAAAEAIPPRYRYDSGAATATSIAGPPNGTTCDPPEDLTTYHRALDPRKTARSALPSPSKSDGTGVSRVVPNCLAITPPPLSAAYHEASLGRKTARSALPSPSKSAGMGASRLAAPNGFAMTPPPLRATSQLAS